jgi:UDP-glucose 4-epimerase
VIAHFGVYEPSSRMTPESALERTELATVATLSAAARAGQLEYVVLRSGLEVYGRRSATVSVPDEDVMPAPRTPFGESLLEAEAIAAGLRVQYGVGVCALRYAPVLGSHVPSPLGRLLRLPAVPVPAFSDPAFSVLHPDDAAQAMVAAIERRYDGPLNVVGPGAASPWQAVRLGGRIPIPIAPMLWGTTARAVEFAGAAIAEHVVELMRHGRTGCGRRAVDALGLENLRPTQDVLRELFDWADVVPIQMQREQVA